MIWTLSTLNPDDAESEACMTESELQHKERSNVSRLIVRNLEELKQFGELRTIPVQQSGIDKRGPEAQWSNHHHLVVAHARALMNHPPCAS